MDASADLLLCWLTLLGWQVETGRDGDTFVAVARRQGEDGELRAAAATATADELPVTIFVAALARLEEERGRKGVQLAAA